MTSWLLLAACSPNGPASNGSAGNGPVPPLLDTSAPEVPLTSAVSRCLVDDGACLDLATVPVTWTVTDGWSVSSVQELGDITGDGLADVVVGLQDGGETWSSVVFGPLGRARELPADEDLGSGTGWVDSAELTGDGTLDLILDGAVIPGPVSTATVASDAVFTLGDGGSSTSTPTVTSTGSSRSRTGFRSGPDPWPGGRSRPPRPS